MRVTAARFAGAAALVAALALPGTAGAEGATWPDLRTAPHVAADGAQDAALVVGIEDYAYLPKIAGARQNAADWYTFLVDGEKIPIGHVRVLLNADGTNDQILKKAAEVSSLVGPGGKVWVVFIGHGSPSQDQKEGVLVGADARPTLDGLYARSVRQSELATALGNKDVVMILDACFSGRTGSGQDIVPGLQRTSLVRSAPATTTMTLLAAGKSDQLAGPLPSVARPAFSYLVLGALRGWGDENHDGVVTAQEAIGYAANALAVLPIGRSQTPDLVGPGAATSLSSGAREAGPNLGAMVIAPAGPGASAQPADPPRAAVPAGPGFGAGLGAMVEVPSVGALQDAPASSLAQLDPDLLALVQAAKRTDASASPAATKARAWDAVVRYPGEHGYKQAATARRDEWQKAADAQAAQATQFQRVWSQYKADSAKLARLSGLDGTVLSNEQKQALRRELDEVYAPWKSRFAEQERRERDRVTGEMAVIVPR